jgi:hypothetical protein
LDAAAPKPVEASPALEVPAPVEPAVTEAPGGAEAAAPAREPAKPLPTAEQETARKQEAYADAQATAEAMIEGLPRRRQGLARPEDYAIDEADLPTLRQAVSTGLKHRPAKQTQPRWLARARLVLRMTNKVVAGRRVEEAKKLLAGGAIGRAVARAESVTELDPDILMDAEVRIGVEGVRGQGGESLLRAAESAEKRGLVHLARVRALQAEEVDERLTTKATALRDRVRAQSNSPSVVLLPFQDLTGTSDQVAGALDAAIAAHLERRGLTQVLSFRTYARAKKSGSELKIAGMLKGDVLRYDVRQVADEEEAAEAQLEDLNLRLRAARRRVVDAPTRDIRYNAMKEVDSLERELARARRRQGTQAFAAAGTEGMERPAVLTLELRYGIYDPNSDKTLARGGFTRTVVGEIAREKELVSDLIDEAVRDMADAVSRRVRAAARDEPEEGLLSGDERLDSLIAMLLATGANRNADAAREVLDQTGYSFREGHSVLSRVQLSPGSGELR